MDRYRHDEGEDDTRLSANLMVMTVRVLLVEGDIAAAQKTSLMSR